MDYYNAACQYGDRKLQDACIRWFLVNLMSHYYTHSDMELRTIPISLMTKLVAHPDLFTIQTEYSIYVMLKYWIYTMHHADDGRPSISTVNEYFTNREGWLNKSVVQMNPIKTGGLCRQDTLSVHQRRSGIHAGFPGVASAKLDLPSTGYCSNS